MKLLTRIVAFLFGLLVLAALAWGGFLFYVENRAAAALDTLSVLLAPQAKLRYGAIRPLPLKGELQVDNLQLDWPSMGSLFVRHATLQRLQPDFYLSPVDAFNGNNLPPVMVLRLQGIGLPLPEQLQSAQDACSLSGMLRLAGLQRQGLLRLGGEGRLSYEFDRAGAGALFHLSLRLDQLGDLALDLELRSFYPEQLAFKSPLVGDSQMRLRLLPDLPRRQLAYCAGDASPLGYLNQLLERSDEELIKDLGWLPGPGIQKGLAAMMGHGGTLELRAQPAAEIDLEAVQKVELEQLPRQLGLSAYLDDRPLADLAMRAPGRSGQVPLESAPDADLPPAPPKYRVTQVDRLSRYIGFRVHLSVGDDVPLREGVLADVNEGRAVLEQRVQGGRFSIFVPLRTVQKAEVLSRR